MYNNLQSSVTELKSSVIAFLLVKSSTIELLQLVRITIRELLN